MRQRAAIHIIVHWVVRENNVLPLQIVFVVVVPGLGWFGQDRDLLNYSIATVGIIGKLCWLQQLLGDCRCRYCCCCNDQSSWHF